MKKFNLLLVLSLLLINGCRAVQPILILQPSDLFWMPLVYLAICFFFAKALSRGENNKFWMWFVLNIILTPILGIIVIVHRLTKHE